jgi:hypothetical protein
MTFGSIVIYANAVGYAAERRITPALSLNPVTVYSIPSTDKRTAERNAEVFSQRHQFGGEAEPPFSTGRIHHPHLILPPKASRERIRHEQAQRQARPRQRWRRAGNPRQRRRRRQSANGHSPDPISTSIYGKLDLPGADLKAMAATIRNQIPADRFGNPGEIAKAAVFLASAEPAFTVGSELVIDGGMSNL